LKQRHAISQGHRSKKSADYCQKESYQKKEYKIKHLNASTYNYLSQEQLEPETRNTKISRRFIQKVPVNIYNLRYRLTKSITNE
jgi:hypothetical protein